jgi:hypothetical protein
VLLGFDFQTRHLARVDAQPRGVGGFGDGDGDADHARSFARWFFAAVRCGLLQYFRPGANSCWISIRCEAAYGVVPSGMLSVTSIIRSLPQEGRIAQEAIERALRSTSGETDE